uniref:Uncharacterized protein n=1 Tax=Globodera rostochiensis TaxID=31243 RepID=A0A914I3A5_GLORO
MRTTTICRQWKRQKRGNPLTRRFSTRTIGRRGELLEHVATASEPSTNMAGTLLEEFLPYFLKVYRNPSNLFHLCSKVLP